MPETADIYPPAQFVPAVILHEVGEDLFQGYAMEWVVWLGAIHIFDYILYECVSGSMVKQDCGQNYWKTKNHSIWSGSF